MTPKLLNHAIFLTEKVGGFSDHRFAIRDSSYRKKMPFELLPRFSWIAGRRSVWLAADWDEWRNDYIHPEVFGLAQSANLIHEATHSLQVDRVGGFAKWCVKYAQRPWRYAFEIEAYRCQIRFVRNLLNLQTFDLLRGYMEGIANLISNDYLLFGYRNIYQILEDLGRDL